jgi:DNA replication protein DnaC
MSLTDELQAVLKKLRLSGLAQSLDLRSRQAVDDDLSHVEFLVRLLADEVERRDGKQLEQRLRRASFEHERTLEDFDFQFNAQIPKSKLLDLATCAFVDRAENVLLVGPTGVGKTHLAQALGHRACRAGYTVLFTVATDMFKQLRAAKGDGSYERRLLRFTSPKLLIVDDLGLRPLRDEEPLDLYEVIRARHEKSATILTSNRDLEEIGKLFGDALLASAAIDRLLDGAHLVEIIGESYRGSPKNHRTRGHRKAQKEQRA